jgi:hypothetical protein
MARAVQNVCFTLNSGHSSAQLACPVWARSGQNVAAAGMSAKRKNGIYFRAKLVPGVFVPPNLQP